MSFVVINPLQPEVVVLEQAMAGCTYPPWPFSHFLSGSKAFLMLANSREVGLMFVAVICTYSL